MLALAVMPVVFVLGELISLGTCFQVTASELAKSSDRFLVALKVPQ